MGTKTKTKTKARQHHNFVPKADLARDIAELQAENRELIAQLDNMPGDSELMELSREADNFIALGAAVRPQSSAAMLGADGAIVVIDSFRTDGENTLRVTHFKECDAEALRNSLSVALAHLRATRSSKGGSLRPAPIGNVEPVDNILRRAPVLDRYFKG